MPPHLYHPDPEEFCAIYRDVSGLDEDQVNPRIVRYFMLLGMARLYEQLVDGTDAIARGEHRGAIGSYLIGSVTHFRNLFLNICLDLPYDPEGAS